MGDAVLGEAKAKEAIARLIKEYPDAKYYLNFSTPLELMVAAIISAQTKDAVVNSVTTRLFRKYKTPEAYSDADEGELAKDISRVAFPQNKARNIIKACRLVLEKHGGNIPKDMGSLVALPGIGRKTANTILINAFGVVEGIPVDTWVIRVPGRIGITSSEDPELIENDLMKLVDKSHWHNIAYVFKAHGHNVCQSRIPICSKCIINDICMRNGVAKSK